MDAAACDDQYHSSKFQFLEFNQKHYEHDFHTAACELFTCMQLEAFSLKLSIISMLLVFKFDS